VGLTIILYLREILAVIGLCRVAGGELGKSALHDSWDPAGKSKPSWEQTMSVRTVAKTRRRRPKSILQVHRRQKQSSMGEYHSKAIGRALDVLELFKDGETTLSLMEISELEGFPESSLFRILLTLEAHGFLLRVADGSYQLSPRLLFGKLYETAQTIRDIVQPFLKQLNSHFNETASFGFLFQNRVEVVDTIDAIQEIRRSNTVGRVLPPHCSSLGKAIVAFQDRSVIDRILRINGIFARTEKTITDHSAVLLEFEQVRKKGYALDREESILGGICIGAPLYEERQHVVAAVSVSAPLIRMSSERESEMIQTVLEVSRHASHAIQTAAHNTQEKSQM
jgi:IclR family acetate operon transcriptional repressor